MTAVAIDFLPPGADAFDGALSEKILKMQFQRGSAYRPRTKHLHVDGSAKFTNRLFLESSPYLLPHAHNPVNWYPWGEEAFVTAKTRNRPVFLSIGYSTCHWCHVMEEESFEDLEIARYLNEHYIAVKVDREERPDIDSIYMSAVQVMTGRGGWPMSVWLTPERRPYFGGTYFPARSGDRGSSMGFLTLLERLASAFKTEREQVDQAGAQLTELISQSLSPAPSVDILGRETIQDVAYASMKHFDSTYGGLSGAPKFPSSFPIRLLFRYGRGNRADTAVDQALRTLDAMSAGGIYDQVGGGFHRYSTDAEWLVPHFEKMLYDNALLVLDYLEGYQLTGNADYKRIIEETLTYVTREMISPEGGFYSAGDADSVAPNGKREEGYFFTWTLDELDAVLTPSEAACTKSLYAVTKHGNFEGRNIFYRAKSLTRVAEELGIDLEQAQTLLEASREKLYLVRSKRPAPLRDDKILTAWNGLMISAFARASFVLNRPDYLAVATRAAGFVQEKLMLDGRLLRTYGDGTAKLNAYLEDYAFFTAGLIDLYEASHDIAWLKLAIGLDATLSCYYEDKVAGAFFATSFDHETLLAREKPAYDGATPSGNSVALMNLLRLYEFRSDQSYFERFQKGLRAFSGTLAKQPLALSEMLLALDFSLDRVKEIVVVLPKNGTSDGDELLGVLRSTFLPNRILSVVREGTDLQGQSVVVPLLEGKVALDGKATAYVCEAGACKLPTNDPEVLGKQLAGGLSV